MEDLKHKDFWKEIIENEDGSLNKEQVYKELEDYSEVMDTATKVFMEVTGGLISKVNTKPESIIRVYRERLEEDIEEAIKEHEELNDKG